MKKKASKKERNHAFQCLPEKPQNNNNRKRLELHYKTEASQDFLPAPLIRENKPGASDSFSLSTILALNKLLIKAIISGQRVI